MSVPLPQVEINGERFECERDYRRQFDVVSLHLPYEMFLAMSRDEFVDAVRKGLGDFGDAMLQCYDEYHAKRKVTDGSEPAGEA